MCFCWPITKGILVSSSRMARIQHRLYLHCATLSIPSPPPTHPPNLHLAPTPTTHPTPHSQPPSTLRTVLLHPTSPHLPQKEDLARIYRLFQRIPKGLEPVAELFRKHVEAQGMQRVKEATEAAAAKKEKDAGACTDAAALGPAR